MQAEAEIMKKYDRHLAQMGTFSEEEQYVLRMLAEGKIRPAVLAIAAGMAMQEQPNAAVTDET